MIELEVAIDLIVPDNTAYTVLVALRRLGYETLERVERSQMYRVRAAAAPSDAPGIIARIERAEVLFNPNKHRMSYALGNGKAAAQTAHWEALVTDRDDDTSSLVRLLQGPFRLPELRSLTRGVAWRLFEPDRPAPRERLEWACLELLANPYSQILSVRPAPARSAPRVTPHS